MMEITLIMMELAKIRALLTAISLFAGVQLIVCVIAAGIYIMRYIEKRFDDLTDEP